MGNDIEEIQLTLWYHEEKEEWTLEVNGALHNHVSSKVIDDWVEYAVVAAQQALIESAYRQNM